MKSATQFEQWLNAPADDSLELAATETSLPVLVVGCGPAGVAAMTAFSRSGVDFEGVESHHSIGGIWDPANPLSSVYEGLNMVTSRYTSYMGTPMSDDYDEYADQSQALKYLRSVADREHIASRVRFSTQFQGADKTPQGTWLARLRPVNGGDLHEKEYRAIVIATGSHNRLHCSYPERQRQEALAAGLHVAHSADYRSPREYAGKRVLVVGAGNSGTDIADRISHAAARTFMSVRTPPWVNPQYFIGTPCDKLVHDGSGSSLPEWLAMGVFMLYRRLAVGSFRRLGWKRPSCALNDRVPVSDRGIVRAIREGRVVVRSPVAAFERGQARFEDANQPPEPIDAVIFATGFERHYPLLDGPPTDQRLSFYLFDRRDPTFVVMTEMVGLRCCWPIFHEQGEAVAAYFAAEQRGSRRAADFNRRRHVPTPPLKGRILRLADEYSIDYDVYARLLRSLVAWLSEPDSLASESRLHGEQAMRKG